MKTLPSASNAGLRARCVGAWQLIQALREDGRITPEVSQAALDGQAIHEARRTGSNDLPEHLLKTKTLLDEMERKLVLEWDPDAVLLAREQRLWYRRGITPICTGRFDYAYRNRDFSRVLIADDKTGRLEVSEAATNDQMRELAALYWIIAPDSVQEVMVVILQPWVTRTPSVAVYHEDQLRLAVALLDKHLSDIADPYAVRTPGAHCSYCPAAAYCEENRVPANSVLALAGRIQKGDYQLPLGKHGAAYLERALTAQKILSEILEKYKTIIAADPNAVPGYYLKAGNTRKTVSDPIGLMAALSIPPEDMLKAGKFSAQAVLKAFASSWGVSEAEAEHDFYLRGEPYIETTQNEPSLARESPRRGRPKELIQARNFMNHDN